MRRAESLRTKAVRANRLKLNSDTLETMLVVLTGFLPFIVSKFPKIFQL